MGFAKTAIIIAITAVCIKLWPVFFTTKLVYEFDGHVEPGFEKVEQIFKQNFENNWDFEGSAFAVCHKGKMVVDLWGGFADASAARLWRKDYMTVMFSTVKAVCAVSIAVLADNGLLKYSDLVTQHWPEFGHNEKEKITVQMLTSHQAGLATVDEPITYELFNDWQKMGAAFEKQKPLWNLGTDTGYHAFTYPLLTDQLIRRVDPQKRGLKQFFHEEIAKPNGLEFYIGIPLELEYKVARISLPRVRDVLSRLLDVDFLKVMFALYRQPADSLVWKVMKNAPWSEQGELNNPEVHAMDIGIGSARALAQLFCLIDSGTLISKTTLEKLMKPVVVDQMDLVLQMNVTRGWGFFHTKNPDGKYVIGHPGFGGQNVKYDPNYSLSMGYVRNGLSPDAVDSWSFSALERAVYEIIKKY